MRGGWFHTGDAAVVHPDGYTEIRDRLKDVIISGGENISSVEVEGVLLRHPAVQEVAIVGFPHERWGEAPHAFVVLKAGATATEAELREFARNHLAHFKAPQRITFVPELPKTATGKSRKYVLRGRPAIRSSENRWLIWVCEARGWQSGVRERMASCAPSRKRSMCRSTPKLSGSRDVSVLAILQMTRCSRIPRYST